MKRGGGGKYARARKTLPPPNCRVGGKIGPMPRRPRAFTLVELLTVIGIVGLLLSFFIKRTGQAEETGSGVPLKAETVSS